MLIALVLRVGYVQLFDLLFTGDDAGSPALQLVRVSGWVLPLPNGARVCVFLPLCHKTQQRL